MPHQTIRATTENLIEFRTRSSNYPVGSIQIDYADQLRDILRFYITVRSDRDQPAVSYKLTITRHEIRYDQHALSTSLHLGFREIIRSVYAQRRTMALLLEELAYSFGAAVDYLYMQGGFWYDATDRYRAVDATTFGYLAERQHHASHSRLLVSETVQIIHDLARDRVRENELPINTNYYGYVPYVAIESAIFTSESLKQKTKEELDEEKRIAQERAEADKIAKQLFLNSFPEFSSSDTKYRIESRIDKTVYYLVDQFAIPYVYKKSFLGLVGDARKLGYLCVIPGYTKEYIPTYDIILQKCLLLRDDEKRIWELAYFHGNVTDDLNRFQVRPYPASGQTFTNYYTVTPNP